MHDITTKPLHTESYNEPKMYNTVKVVKRVSIILKTTT